jgi:alpha-L-fucosidase
VIFSDAGEWDRSAEEWKTLDFLAWLYNEAPNREEVVVNDRFGNDMPGRHGDYFSSEYEDAEGVGAFHPWEESRGIGGSYGFNRDENIDDYSTSEELVHELIDIVARGGNLLLNVGPTADGRIPVIQQQRLVDIGAWLDVNGEAIFGTKPWSGAAQVMGRETATRFTRKGDALFLICTRWPEKPLEIQGLELREEIRVRLLGFDGSVEWHVEGGNVTIIPPGLTPATSPCDHAWVFEISPRKL